MDYRTELLHLDAHFPFAVYHGTGFSADDLAAGRAYMHRHHSLEINSCLRGQGRYIIGDRVYDVAPGDLFIINDLEYHQAINVSGDLQLLVIVFDTDLVLSGGEDYALIRAFYEWKSGFKHRIAADSPALSAIFPLIYVIEREWQEQEVGYRMMLRALLVQLLAMLYRNFELTEGYAEKVSRFQSGYIRLAPALSMIDANFASPLTLEQLADTVHMNRNYFSTLFSQLMGCPASEYILRRRLRHALQLLVSTDASVISIALDSGFRNVSYFNRAFKEQFGLPPGRYREQVRQAEHDG